MWFWYAQRNALFETSVKVQSVSVCVFTSGKLVYFSVIALLTEPAAIIVPTSFSEPFPMQKAAMLVLMVCAWATCTVREICRAAPLVLLRSLNSCASLDPVLSTAGGLRVVCR